MAAGNGLIEPSQARSGLNGRRKLEEEEVENCDLPALQRALMIFLLLLLRVLPGSPIIAADTAR